MRWSALFCSLSGIFLLIRASFGSLKLTQQAQWWPRLRQFQPIYCLFFSFPTKRKNKSQGKNAEAADDGKVTIADVKKGIYHIFVNFKTKNFAMKYYFIKVTIFQFVELFSQDEFICSLLVNLTDCKFRESKSRQDYP